MGAEMYTGMSALQDPSHVVERGIALHKMIRAVTMVGVCCSAGASSLPVTGARLICSLASWCV